MKILKFKYVLSFLRLVKIKTFNAKKVKIDSWFIYIGKGVEISAENGFVHLGKMAYISDRVTLQCTKNGVITIGERCFINKNTMVVAHGNITIGKNTLVADSVSIFDHDHATSDPSKELSEQGYIIEPIIVGENVWIGSHVVICRGVHIGDRAVVGACAMVNKDLPSMTLSCGVPAKVVKRITNELPDSGLNKSKVAEI